MSPSFEPSSIYLSLCSLYKKEAQVWIEWRESKCCQSFQVKNPKSFYGITVRTLTFYRGFECLPRPSFSSSSSARVVRRGRPENSKKTTNIKKAVICLSEPPRSSLFAIGPESSQWEWGRWTSCGPVKHSWPPPSCLFEEEKRKKLPVIKENTEPVRVGFGRLPTLWVTALWLVNRTQCFALGFFLENMSHVWSMLVLRGRTLEDWTLCPDV